MQRRVITFLLVLFLIFLIINDATGTGDTANSFWDWVGDGLGKTRDFVNAMLGEESPPETVVVE